MEFNNIMALVALSMFIPFLLSPSACHCQLQDDTINPSPYLFQSTPRKLKLAQVHDETRSATVVLSNHDERKTTVFADRTQHKEEDMEKVKREGKEEERMSGFMVMDYNGVKKRCPSHNESPPSAP